jgi:hypothetical protein
MISFGFEDGFADSFDEGLGARTAFRGLSETGRMETFLAGTKAEAGAKAGAGTRGTETEAGVTEAVEIAGTIETGAGAGTETEAGVTLAVETFGIVGIAEPEAEARTGVGIALRIEAFSYSRLNKSSR